MVQEIPEELLLANVGQKVFVVRDGKVLMCRGTYAPVTHLWDFPGGRMHKGEFPKEALTRELKEELGIDFKIGAPVFTTVTYTITETIPLQIPRYYIVFEATPVDPNAEFIVATDELAEVKWVAKDEIAALETWLDWKTFLTEYFKTH